MKKLLIAFLLAASMAVGTGCATTPTKLDVAYLSTVSFDEAVRVLTAAYLFGSLDAAAYDQVKPWIDGGRAAADKYHQALKNADETEANRQAEAFNAFALKVIAESQKVNPKK